MLSRKEWSFQSQQSRETRTPVFGCADYPNLPLSARACASTFRRPSLWLRAHDGNRCAGRARQTLRITCNPHPSDARHAEQLLLLMPSPVCVATTGNLAPVRTMRIGSIANPKRWAILGPTLPPIVEPGGRNIRMAQPLPAPWRCRRCGGGYWWRRSCAAHAASTPAPRAIAL